MLDHNVIGDVTRISPEAPVPIFNSFKETFKLGGAANVAAGIKKLGVILIYILTLRKMMELRS